MVMGHTCGAVRCLSDDMVRSHIVPYFVGSLLHTLCLECWPSRVMFCGALLSPHRVVGGTRVMSKGAHAAQIADAVWMSMLLSAFAGILAVTVVVATFYFIRCA